MGRYNTVGERIKAIRKIFNLTQKDFAKPIGVSYGHISNIEKNKDAPSKALIKLISSEYEIEEDWIINGCDDPEDNPFNHKIKKYGPYKTGWIELDDILCSSPPRICSLQEKFLASVYILLQLNATLEIENREKNLETLNKMLELMNNAVFTMLSTKDHNISSAVFEDRIDILFEDVFGEFVETLDEFKETFLDSGNEPDNNDEIE